jgi:hypothetical protein
MMRPKVSAAPPAANGAMIFTGRLGQVSACAGTPARTAKAASAANRTRSLIVLRPILLSAKKASRSLTHTDGTVIARWRRRDMRCRRALDPAAYAAPGSSFE